MLTKKAMVAVISDIDNVDGGSNNSDDSGFFFFFRDDSGVDSRDDNFSLPRFAPCNPCSTEVVGQG